MDAIARWWFPRFSQKKLGEMLSILTEAVVCFSNMDGMVKRITNYSGQILETKSADGHTLAGGLVRESPAKSPTNLQNAPKSLIC